MWMLSVKRDAECMFLIMFIYASSETHFGTWLFSAASYRLARWPHGFMCLCATSNLHRFFTFTAWPCDREAGRRWGSVMEWHSACSEVDLRMHLRSVMRSAENFSREEHLMTVSAPQAPVHFQSGNQRSLQPELWLQRGNSLLECRHQRQY